MVEWLAAFIPRAIVVTAIGAGITIADSISDLSDREYYTTLICLIALFITHEIVMGGNNDA